MHGTGIQLQFGHKSKCTRDALDAELSMLSRCVPICARHPDTEAIHAPHAYTHRTAASQGPSHVHTRVLSDVSPLLCVLALSHGTITASQMTEINLNFSRARGMWPCMWRAAVFRSCIVWTRAAPACRKKVREDDALWWALCLLPRIYTRRYHLHTLRPGRQFSRVWFAEVSLAGVQSHSSAVTRAAQGGCAVAPRVAHRTPEHALSRWPCVVDGLAACLAEASRSVPAGGTRHGGARGGARAELWREIHSEMMLLT
jgi:hypothetical protein